MPKTMTDFRCLVSDIINDLGYVPKEFIFAYQVFGSDVKERFFINTHHISLLGDDLQRIIGTDLLNRSYDKLRKYINVFNLGTIDEEVIDSYNKPLIKARQKTSMQNTAEEYFDYKDSEKKIEPYYKNMIK